MINFLNQKFNKTNFIKSKNSSWHWQHLCSEILYDAKISPFKRGKDLKSTKLVQLFNLKKILKKAIKYGGSTINDYVSPDGTLG